MIEQIKMLADSDIKSMSTDELRKKIHKLLSRDIFTHDPDLKVEIQQQAYDIRIELEARLNPESSFKH